MDFLFDPNIWIAFAMLTTLEIVLGIDNIIFISILVDKLPEARRETARRLGLFMAMFMRIGLLLVLAWIIGLVTPLFSAFGKDISGRDLILILGGLFLIWKSTTEIHQSMEGAEDHTTSVVKATFTSVILQIMVIDLVFSLDSIITAVGMVDDVRVMIAAVIASVALMMVFAGPIGRFVSDHPTIKMLALSFLVVVGPVARLELLPADRPAHAGTGHDPLIEAQLSAERFGELGLKEGDTVLLSARKARVFLQPEAVN